MSSSSAWAAEQVPSGPGNARLDEPTPLAEAGAAIMLDDGAHDVVVELIAVTKVYSESSTPAVRDMHLAVREGEFFSLLGPSGSGKTTTLRMIAGFERPTVGRIKLGGVDVTRVP